jgi:hypothetical protein
MGDGTRGRVQSGNHHSPTGVYLSHAGTSQAITRWWCVHCTNPPHLEPGTRGYRTAVQHLLQHGVGVLEEEGGSVLHLLRCPYCAKLANSDSALQAHLQSCGKSRRCERHHLLDHGNCQAIKKSTAPRTLPAFHAEREDSGVAGNQPWHCLEQCSDEFFSWEEAQEHALNHSTKCDPMPCNRCQGFTTDAGRLVNHGCARYQVARREERRK